MGEVATAEVAVVSVAEACHRFESVERPELAACYFAAAMMRDGLGD